MKEKDFYVNNSKKIIIGVPILFCTVILIVGVTTAYFNQGTSNEIDEIVSSDVVETLKYTDNDDYMKDNLIPVIEEDVSKFAMYTYYEGDNTDNICRYTEEYNACSLYEFTIKNTSEVVQKINATLTPNPNTFKNLYYIIYEEEQEKLNPSSKIIRLSTHINETDTSNMFEEVVLNPDEEKTYTIVFYIKSMDYDQTAEDAGKNFGAIVSINSLTTGYNISKTYGNTCYDVEKINGGKNDGLFKITKFKGISEETGQPIPGCGVSVSEDSPEYYTVVVPSKIGEYDIDVIGSGSFAALSYNEESDEVFINNSLVKVNSVIISEGIKEIEDCPEGNEFSSVFPYLGYEDLEEENYHFVNITLPQSLEYIGARSMQATLLNKLTIPSNVETIGRSAFYYAFITELTFDGAEDGTSKLKMIDELSFYGSRISSLTIPKNVETIGSSAFTEIENLETLIFAGALDGTSKLKTIGKSAFDGTKITTLTIPKSVVTIKDTAFRDSTNLTELIFMTESDGTSDLRYIGNRAFYDTKVLVSTSRPLFIPSNVTYIGAQAFYNSSSYLGTIRFAGDSTGFDPSWKSNAQVIKQWD